MDGPPPVPVALFLFVTENILSQTCVVLKTYDAIYSVVNVLESNAYYCAIISRWVTNKKNRVPVCSWRKQSAHECLTRLLTLVYIHLILCRPDGLLKTDTAQLIPHITRCNSILRNLSAQCTWRYVQSYNYKSPFLAISSSVTMVTVTWVWDEGDQGLYKSNALSNAKCWYCHAFDMIV